MPIRTILIVIAASIFGTVLADECSDPMEYVRREVAAGSRDIVVPPGTYRIAPKGDVYLKIKDLNDARISFENVRVIGSVNVQMLDIENCRNLTIGGLTVDYDPLPFTQAKIVSVDNERNWTIKLIPGYPKEGIMTVGDTRVQVFSPKDDELVNPLRYANRIAVTRLDADTCRITGGGNRTGEVGDIVVLNATNGTPNCTVVRSRRCENLTFEKFTVYSGTMAFVETDNLRTVYRNCVIDRCPPEADYAERGYRRLRSLNADAFHCKDGRVGPQILDCKANYQGDDGVNISGMYSLVTEGDGDEIRVLVPFDLIMAPGDTLEIMTVDGTKVPDAKVLSIVPDGTVTPDEAKFVSGLALVEFYRNPKSPCLKKAYRLKLDRLISLPRGSVVISTSHMGNGFVIRGCDFGFIRSRAILIKASDGVIADNRIAACWGPAIKVSPEYFWLEGGCACRLKITGNRFSDNRDWPILIAGEPGVKADMPADSHHDLVIADNEIGGSSRGVKVVGCTGLTIENNKIAQVGGDPQDAVLLTNVEQLRKTGNRITRRENRSDREFLPLLDSVTIDGQPLYRSGNGEPGKIAVSSDRPVEMSCAFRNNGTKPSNFRASAFVHFELADSSLGRGFGGDYEPRVSTREWTPGKTVSDSRNVDFSGKSGRLYRVYVGLYYFADGQERVTLANPDQLPDRKVFVGTIQVK